MKDREIICLIICLTVCFYTISRPNVLLVNNVRSINRDTIESDTFNLTNTSETFNLLNDWIYLMGIGATWNLTITLTENSSSAVRFNLTEVGYISPSWLEGSREFSVLPGETQSNIYVNHFITDDTLGFNFKYQLSEPTEQASGFFHMVLVKSGYRVSIGTSQLYVHNITAWLIARSQTSSTSLNFSLSLPILLLTIAVAYSYLRKRNKC
ncbi:MAG: hypothetical protein ACW98W_18135 [Candidatus Hodarchaeales archaeon]